jgi:hypothetical protein
LADEWVNAHQPQYEQLFDDGQAQVHEVNFTPSEAALSALTRYTYMERRPRKLEYTTMAEVAQGVSAVLDASEQGLFGVASDVLHTVETVTHDAVKSAATRVITHWERACLRRDLPSPFEDMVIDDIQPEDIALTATGLILMTAAAFAQVIKKHAPKSAVAVPKWAVNGIKYYGPSFTNDFIEGNNSHEILSDKAARTIIVLAEGQRKSVLATSPKTPELTLAKITGNLDAPSSEELAGILGWSIERIEAIFTPSAMRQLSVNRRDKPLIATVQRIRYLYDEVLTPEAIGHKLGITTAQAEFTFRSSLIHNLVFRSPDTDPTERLGDILALTRRLTNSFSLSYPLAVWMAAYLPGQALDRAALVEREQTNRPHDISKSLWAATVAKYPKQGDPRRATLVSNVKTFWNFLNALSLDAKPNDAHALVERVPDFTYSPEYMLFGEEWTSNLRDTVESLLNKANVSASNRRKLLEFYSVAGVKITPSIAKLLKQVRTVAK